ncbi:MAG: nitroreductase family deazaflavin-dependent oxidoreductase [Candidatus Lokiarchaeota archaeon]|nr:nitroreductase family deazaflavin-dependent oxidoreductase [Candidatus Lokiarchaeota archaeon]
MVQHDKGSEAETLPRPGSALYNLNHPDEKIKEKTLKKYKRVNKFLVLPLYRLKILPLLGFGRVFLILITKGRISGKKRRTPLEYHRIEGIITIFSGRGEDSGWMKNIRAASESVWVKHGFHSFHAKVDFIQDESEKLKIVKWYVNNHSKSAKMLFGWNPKKDNPEITDFSEFLKMISIIRLIPKEN